MTSAAAAPDRSAGWYTLATDAVVVQVLARPGSTRQGILRVEARGLVVALHAPPAKGRANAELIELLARRLHLPRGAINLVRGETARAKTIRIASDHPRALAAALVALVPTP